MVFDQDLPLPTAQQDGNSIPDWCSPERGSPFPVAPSQRASFPEGTGHGHSSACPQLPIIEVLFWAGVAER